MKFPFRLALALALLGATPLSAQQTAQQSTPPPGATDELAECALLSQSVWFCGAPAGWVFTKGVSTESQGPFVRLSHQTGLYEGELGLMPNSDGIRARNMEEMGGFLAELMGNFGSNDPDPAKQPQIAAAEDIELAGYDGEVTTFRFLDDGIWKQAVLSVVPGHEFILISIIVATAQNTGDNVAADILAASQSVLGALMVKDL